MPEETPMPLRRIPLKGIDNFRDLGGYPCRYGETSFGVIYRSSEISNIDKSDLPLISSLGINSIIDFRDSRSREERPDQVSAFPSAKHYVLEVNGGGRIAKDEEDMFVSYFEMIEERESASHILKAIIECKKPMLMHCSAGKDRTGVFTSLLLLANGVDPLDVNADYLLSLPLLKHTRDITLKRHPDFPRAVLYPSCDFFPEFIERFMKRYGSVEGYFRSIGLSGIDYRTFSNLLGIQEKSFGAALFKNGCPLLEKMGLGHISIPKGHAEAFDKSERDTIEREIEEELSLSPDDYDLFDGERYAITFSPKEGHVKRVEFGYGIVKNDSSLKVDGIEVEDAYYLPFEKAMEEITYDSDRRVVKWAYSKLKP